MSIQDAQRFPVTLTAKKASSSIKSADEAWFESVFQQHWSRVYGVLFRIVGNHDEAEDLALETFYRLHERPPARRETKRLGGWLYRVATNLGFNALRTRRRRARYEEEAGQLHLEQMKFANPLEEIERAEELELVRTTLSQIKTRSAQLLILRHSGLSYAEIAMALEVAPGSVGTMLARAEREFEERFAEAESKLSRE